jgi:hypothetical protein
MHLQLREPLCMQPVMHLPLLCTISFDRYQQYTKIVTCITCTELRKNIDNLAEVQNTLFVLLKIVEILGYKFEFSASVTVKELAFGKTPGLVTLH